MRSWGQPSNVDTFPHLRSLRPRMPSGVFTPTRTVRGRARSEAGDDQDMQGGSSLSSPEVSHSTNAYTCRSLDASQDLVEDLSYDDSQDAQEEGATELPSSATYYLDIHPAQSSSPRRGSASNDLPPLMYSREVPYPPRHPIDCRALRSLDNELNF